MRDRPTNDGRVSDGCSFARGDYLYNCVAATGTSTDRGLAFLPDDFFGNRFRVGGITDA